MNTNTTRICKKCQHEKPAHLFRLVRSSKQGNYRIAQCRVCERAKERLRHREKRKSPDFVAMEKERSRARTKKWGAVLVERYRTDPQYRSKVIEASKLYWKKLSTSDREKYLASRRRGYQKRAMNVPLWYANRLLGGTSSHRYPIEMLLLKQTHKRIDNFLKGRYEEHNRDA